MTPGGRWLDHLPPWMAWGALASTGTYSLPELGGMAAPLLLGALVQACGWSLHRWRRLVEWGTLAGFLALVLAHAGLLPTVVNTLFLLCGARLCLPRELAQRRQLLLMGFLLFLTTAITTADLDFLVWSLIWVGGGAAVLLQQNWERSAGRRPGAAQGPPFRLVAPWAILAVALAAGFFVILPRLRVGYRALPLDGRGATGLQGGLSDFLELGGKGPIASSREVALRVLPSRDLPPGQRQAFPAAAQLLRCFVLEELAGQRWELSPSTRPRSGFQWTGLSSYRPLTAEFFVEPCTLGYVPLPYGAGDLEPSPGNPLESGRGSGVHFRFLSLRSQALHVAMTPSDLMKEPPPTGQALARLTAPGLNTGSALRWSLRAAPGDLPPRELAQRLTQALRTFRYTLDNPSGAKANPLEDFLEHSRAGHCEYFASALALMMRQRGVPSRVAIGYRLGPWIEEGGYFLVTQAEAHSWVEYYDAPSGGWRPADPTPPEGASPLDADSLYATLARWGDALRFRWDRHVVRFSDEDQITGLTWIQEKSRAAAHWHPKVRLPKSLAWAAAATLLACWALAAGARRLGPRRAVPGPGAGLIRELAPLVRKTRRVLPVAQGETARAWLTRLAQAHPARATALEALAREADAVAYGSKPPLELKALAKAEARAWKTRP